jgi:multidrug efflux pump subunit AcrB
VNAIVQIALRRPYTFVVLAILILLFGAMSALRTPTDIFPPIKIPVIAAVWTYTGLSPSDMSGRIIYYYERTLTTTVSNIEHIESQSYYGSDPEAALARLSGCAAQPLAGEGKEGSTPAG